MKKSILNVALLSVLFVLGACSVSPDAFLDSVKGKTAYSDAAMTQEYGVFSADGKILDNGMLKFKFVEMVDGTTGSYIRTAEVDNLESKMAYSIATSDGKTGTATMTEYTYGGEDGLDDENTKPIELWFK